MATFSNNLVAKSGKSGISEYYCEQCDYKCCKKYNWEKHLTTAKHSKATESQHSATEKWQKVANERIYCCENCGKKYNNRTGLWRHNKTCNKESENKDELILMILKQNSEILKENCELRKEQTDIKEMILEIIKNGTTNNIITHTNSHNKSFNLNFFLNETCKNAMNITDFVDSIKLQLSDLVSVGEIGFVEGISKIIVKNLNDLDETIRPVHCTDKKRETMYIKDGGEWNKEDEKRSRLKKVINKIADKNIRLLPEFREKYPDYKDSSSKISDKYDKMVIEVMGGLNGEPAEKEDKIIHNISKCVGIDKLNV